MARTSLPNRKTKKQSSPSPLPSPQVALYMRVSTEDQADRGTIEAQRDFLRQFANLYQLPVAGEYADDGVTGTLPLGARPEGQRLLQDAEAGAFGCVIVYRLTRLGRSLKALTDAHETLSHFKVTIRSATEPFDTSTPIGTFLFQLLGSLAELDRAQVLEQLSRGRDRVAKDGKWTDGPIPYGYVLDAAGCLTPSKRFVDALQMTEAEVVQDLYQRVAAGSSADQEARRLQALAPPTTRYYSNGTTRTGSKWYSRSIINILTSTTYKGTHVFKSRYGEIARTVPALVDAALWDRANATLRQNRRLPKSNATHLYLLRGLMTCAHCGAAYVGQPYARKGSARGFYYRCSGRTPDRHARRERCTSRAVNIAAIEPLVWADCMEFIQNPGAALDAAQRQLHDRMQQAANLDQHRGAYMKLLAEKASERERILTMYRRGRVTVQDAEGQLDAIDREEAELRQQCTAIDTQKMLAEAYESQLTEASLLLHRLQDTVKDIDQADDQAAKRQIFEILVQGIRIETQVDRTASAHITYHFSPPRVADVSTASSTSVCYTLTHLVSPLPKAGHLQARQGLADVVTSAG